MSSPNLRRYSMLELLDRLGMPYDIESHDVAKIRGCPFCQRQKVKVNIDLSKDAWRCPACGKSGYTLNFYSLYCLGVQLPQYSPPEDEAKAAKELREFMDGPDAPNIKPRPSYEKRPAPPPVPVAADDHLDKVYSAMAQIPALNLLESHRDNLHRRGLSNEVIDRNGYCSIPSEMVTDQYFKDLYELAGGESLRRSQKTLRRQTPQQISFGLMIAHALITQGLDVQGVPGFFKFGVHWCYWCTPGILIPTRNIRGQIVIWQIRRDTVSSKKDCRYFTVANRTLPGHVTESVSRCHFPLGNSPLSTGVPVIVTEGPLKADVASHLFGAASTFIAIPGIQTTKDLLSYVPLFHEAGISEIYNALDMDRLTNDNVRKGSDKLKAAFREEGIQFVDMFWGIRFATSKLSQLLLIATVKKNPL